ncbi:MAG: acyl-CoA/acyl-ACP dehydrogenase [Pseudomonadales bacterium]|nr:acyl-CoA/acyl-ACP dehydrogenase [Pseudomonadales bacterium]
MEYGFTEEQAQFRDIVARFCREKAPVPVIRKLIDSESGFDQSTWKQMCDEVGLVGLNIPESRGGAGFGPVELGIVMEELGYSLLPSPYLSCAVLACTAVAEIEDAAIRDRLLGEMMTGASRATLAVAPRDGNPLISLSISEDARLSGTLDAVLDVATADRLLVIASRGNANVLFSLDGPDGIRIESLRTMDGTRRQGRVVLDNARATALGTLDDAAVARIRNTALVALACEMVGGARALLESAVSYTNLRVQFGRTIGSFQAIKHRLADLLVDVELATAGARQAAQALAAGEDAGENASLAKFVAADACMKAALECIQLHGGIGFTWENDTHLWFRRAKSSEVLFGTPSFHRERMLKEMGV